MKALKQLAPGEDLIGPASGDTRLAYVDAFDLFILPLLDGILRHQAEDLANQVASAIGLETTGLEVASLRRRLINVAV